MFEKKHKKHMDEAECYDCGGSLELFEFDMQKETRIMKCKDCGLFHYYKKDLLGRWKLLKVSKNFIQEK
jgi:uncharacterized Zn finger protein